METENKDKPLCTGDVVFDIDVGYHQVPGDRVLVMDVPPTSIFHQPFLQLAENTYEVYVTAPDEVQPLVIRTIVENDPHADLVRMAREHLEGAEVLAEETANVPDPF